MKLFYSILLVASTSFMSHSQATFNVVATGTDPTIDAAIDFTTDIWGLYLNSAVPIKIKVIYADLTSAGPLALTIPNGEKDFASAPLPSVWFASCLANSIEGTELNPGENDMDIYVNSSSNYYFGTDGNPGAGQYDFVSIFLHEIGHGLGILSLSDLENGEGSFGFVDASNIFPLQSSFPFPVLEGLPSIWDTYIINSNGDNLIDLSVFPNPSASLVSEFQGNDLFFTGPNATASNWGDNPKMFAPSAYSYGSSLQHFDESSFPLSSGNSFMTPYISATEVEQNPGGIMLGALQDIGWTTNVVGQDEQAIASIELYPNPASDELRLNLGNIKDNNIEISIVDLVGNVLSTYEVNSSSVKINLSQLPAGAYFCKVMGDSNNASLKFIKK